MWLFSYFCALFLKHFYRQYDHVLTLVIVVPSFTILIDGWTNGWEIRNIDIAQSPISIIIPGSSTLMTTHCLAIVSLPWISKRKTKIGHLSVTLQTAVAPFYRKVIPATSLVSIFPLFHSTLLSAKNICLRYTLCTWTEAITKSRVSFSRSNYPVLLNTSSLFSTVTNNFGSSTHEVFHHLPKGFWYKKA